MKKSFLQKLIAERIIDTKNYRYILDTDCRLERPLVKRIELDKLETTAAINSWEIIEEV